MGMPSDTSKIPDFLDKPELNSLIGKRDNETKQIALTLYDQARLMEGQLPEDIGDYCSRVSDYMQSSL